ncbi:hypothetical protein B9T31_13750 [Acinetobacter sp. ANC 4558]|uniref:hypothetical protein n=1 Tax=Acinetobacter sp. ANC 4558 TaxID=1977876 RepID=UPI000B722513|nr:hypothetical protein [Acinetobacter sp. ANC 4558]OTG84211.1 hypothetical protein B9T31_13750 [Acinetobacter sp. ANC 4558]
MQILLKDKSLRSLFLLTLSYAICQSSYANETEEKPQVESRRIDFGGAIRMRFDYDADRDIRKLGFDTAIANLDFYYDQLSGHAEYRILGGAYPYDYTDKIGDIHFAKKAYLAYRFNEQQSVQVGLNQVPIGFQPYYTSTVIESLGYIAGVEDLYRVGVKYDYKVENHQVLFGYYVANAWKGKGTGQGAYYSNQIIPADPSLEHGTDYKEKDAVAFQYNYTQQHDAWTSNYGISGYYSKLKSKAVDEKNAHREVYGLHYSIDGNRLGIKLITLFNHLTTPADQTTFGSYDGTFNVANKGVLYSADVNYKIPQFNVKDIDNFNIYAHYSRYDKSKKDFLDSEQVVLGSAFTYKKNFYIAAEWLFGKNNPYIGSSSYAQSLAAGGTNRWENQVNINIGYYF